MARVDQWVAFSGWLSSVRVMIASIAVSSVARGAPERGRSTRPSRRWARKRARQVVTLGRLIPRLRAMPVFVEPGSAQASTIRARWASA